MNAKIDQLTPAEMEWIGQQLKDAKAFVQRVLGKESEDLPSADDLDRAINTWMHSPNDDSSDANAVINCIGVAFGQHLANTSPLEWVIASDDYGTELALYAFPGQGDVLVYPQNFVAKRYEAAEGPFIVKSLHQIRQDVSDVQNANQQKKWWKPW
jgi:hypothetical protein